MPRVRWECPNDKHAAVLGPRAPRTNATVRYCLPCSETTGVLVLRTAPVLERARAARTEAARARRKHAADRKATRIARHWTVNGVDVWAEWLALRRTPTYKRAGLPPNHPILRLRHSRNPTQASGRCVHGGSRICVTLGDACDRARIVTLLIHELAHAVTPPREHHSPLFWTNVVDLTRDRFGVRDLRLATNGTLFDRHDELETQIRHYLTHATPTPSSSAHGPLARGSL